MIKRDEHNIIIQHNADYPQADGGDSCSRVALMSMTGSSLDNSLLDDFIIDGQLVRHPYQTSNGQTGDAFRNWADPKETSRDQLICFAAGITDYNIEARDAVLRHADKWFINKDILMPHHRLMLYKSSSYGNLPLYIELLGYPMLLLNILYNALVTPKAEQNQMIAMLSRFHPIYMKLFVKLHRHIYENVSEYFNGYPWRDQSDLGDAINSYIKRRTSEHSIQRRN